MSPEHEATEQPLWRRTLDAQRELNSGIGGWLLLVAVGLVVAPFRMLYSAANDLWPAWKEVWVDWNEFESPGKMVGYLGFESAVHLLGFVFCLVAAYLFFGKKRVFRRFVFVWLAVQLVAPFARLVVLGIALSPEQREAVGVDKWGTYLFVIVHCTFWTLYFARSERVKNTFVR